MLLGLQEDEDPSISRHMKVTRLPALRNGGYSWYSFLLQVIVRPKGLR